MSTNARITSASRVNAVEIRTPAALAAIAKKFTPVVLQEDDTPVPPSNADYFSRMMLPTNVELDSGNYHTYDIQFDTRYIHNYILYHTTSRFPEMNIKGHPYVTPLSLAGYCFSLLYALMLACDKTFRPTPSWQAARFLSDSDKRDLYDKLLQSRVPTFFADLLIEFSPVYDPRRTNHIFCPSLAGYTHSHDFGRTLHPAIFYQAHHLLASTRTNRDPDDVIDDLMAIEIITVGNTEYRISNFYGTWYDNQHHTNFLNQDFFAFFNPIVGRALSQRPTFARLNLAPEVYIDNIYENLLLASDQNISLMTILTDALSTFVLSDDSKAPQLGSVLASLSGTLLLSHSIEPPTLPTWTAAKYTQNASPVSITDKKFSEDHKFMIEPTAGTETAVFPDDPSKITESFYHVIKKKFSAKNRKVKHLTFAGKLSVHPNVLYFQPYDVSPSSLGLTIASGMKIELSEIAGFMVPTERPEDSLDDNNSLVKISAIAASTITPLFDSPTAANAAISIMERESIDSTSQPIMLAIRTAARSVFPRFYNESLPSALATPDSSGLKTEDDHYSSWTGFNVKAGTEGKISATDGKFYLWSSYRIVTKYKAPEPKDILFVASFRPIYGANVTLSRSKHPSLLIPH